ncbi:MAG TPA: TRAM domain-containing protein [Thermoanaerobaculia bacterium]|nr:TRAM domain-containing protein [Thermoanaerobaculia bacterium]
MSPRPAGRGDGGGRRPGGKPAGGRREGGGRAGERPAGRGGRRIAGDGGKRSARAERPRRAPRATAPPAVSRLALVDEAEVTVEKLVVGGEGLARLEGVPIFVARAAPGDRLRVRLVERRPDYARAAIVEILEPGPGRRPDPYPELSRTGICDLQHLDDALQPHLKAAAVREALQRLGRIELPPRIEVVAGPPWGYRLRTQLHAEVDAATGEVRVGYHARGSNELVAVTRCPLLVPELESLLPELPERLAASPHRRIDLAAGDRGAVTAAPLVPGLPHGEVSMTIGGHSLSYDARCFFQAHRQLLPYLVELAVGPWEGGEAYDLYAGVGLFSLPLARRYGRVVSVEADRVAARYGRNNARRNRLPQVSGVGQVVESWIAALPDRPDRVLVDPPRAGLTGKVRQALAARRARRLTYVSCDAATLARDLRMLAPVYRIDSIQLVDLFPQTGHMEAVVQLASGD